MSVIPDLIWDPAPLLSSVILDIFNRGSRAFVFSHHFKRSEESRRRSTHSLCRLVARLRAASVIDLAEVRRGKFFRLVAEMIVDGTNVSIMLLARSLADIGEDQPKMSFSNSS